MGDPCKQEGAIGGLEATQDAILETLQELKHGQERFMTILENIARQGTKIQKLETDQEILFSRVRKIELGAVEQGTKITLAAGGISLFITAVVAYISKLIGK